MKNDLALLGRPRKFAWLVLCSFIVFVSPEIRADTEGDSVASLYQMERLVEVRVAMDPADWMAMRQQHPDRVGQMVGTVTNPEPYSHFRATVFIDGRELQSVGVRKKGNLGSVVSTRPSLKLDFDEYDSDQRFRGLKRMTLNNNVQNGAVLHQYLAYHIFRRAGLAAPRCNLAHVIVNGEDLGIYSNVEPIKKPFLKKQFGNGGGNLYESGGEFYGKGYRSFPKKNNRSEGDWSDLKGIAEALVKPDAEVLEALGKHLDLEAFYRFWAIDVLVGDWDGFICNRNNAYLYNNPGNGKIYVIPWGLDSVFEDPGLYMKEGLPKSVKAVSALPQRLYQIESSRARYLQVMREVLREAWDEGELNRLIEQAIRITDGKMHLPKALFLDEISVVQRFIKQRRVDIQTELDLGVPEWPASGNRPPMSGGQMLLSAAFDTEWFGALSGKADESGGTASLTLIRNDKKEELTNVIVRAGLESRGPRRGYPVIVLEGYSTDFGRVAWNFYIDPFKFETQRDFAVDFYEVFGLMVAVPEGGFVFRDIQLLGMAIGKLSLLDASTEKGKPVSGTLEVQVQLN